MDEVAGELLRQSRVRARMSQTELARAAGVAQSVISAYEAGQRQPSLPTLRRLVAATGQELRIELGEAPPKPMGLPDSRLGRLLRRHRRAVLSLADRRGAHNVRVFGSVARGTDGPESDVDLLVDLDPTVSLVGLAGLERELRELLKVDVDVIPAAGLKPRIRQNVLTEAIPL